MLSKPPERILIVQTAFLGDVILASPLLEKLHKNFPNARLDFILRKGNEGLFKNHPFLGEVLVWDKKNKKLVGLWGILNKVRAAKYDLVINLQRFAASGLLTIFSGAGQTRGFNKNPFSFLFSKAFAHEIPSGKHEVDRNMALLEGITDISFQRPVLYPSHDDFNIVMGYKTGRYICLAPSSVWFTKQFPSEKWVAFLQNANPGLTCYLLGAAADFELCENIKNQIKNPGIHNLAGKLSLLESAALMQGASMNFVNDSAPMHMASAMNAPVTAFFCSTVPGFGFGPLSDTSIIVETQEPLSCRPCGLHGYKACPEGHFKCAKTIDVNELTASLKTL
jgi:ADP-heptose:LPS heptosyltransferase